MVLASLGREVPEITLRQMCECDDEGTSISKAVECAKRYGFIGSFRAYLHFEELRAELERGRFPVVYLQPTSVVPQDLHSVVVTDIRADQVLVLDPHNLFGGSIELDREDFTRQWQAINGLTIIIE